VCVLLTVLAQTLPVRAQIPLLPQWSIRDPRSAAHSLQPQQPGPGLSDIARIDAEEWQIDESGKRIRARNVVIGIGEYTLTGGQVEGNIDRELVFTGNPALTYRGQTVTGDVIRFAPRTKTFRVENVHTALTPDFLQGRLLSPLYLSGGSIFGQRRQPIFGQDIDSTTCELPDPHYLFRASEIKVDPGKRLTLRRATVILWGQRLFTLPTLVIPLDRRPRRLRLSDLPHVGRSQDEGWFVKSAFNYLLADRVPGLFRLDLMEKKGIGIGFDQVWNLARLAGAFALYAIPTGGTGSNFSGRLNNRQNIGGGQSITLDNDFQQRSYLSLPQTTSFNTRFGYSRLMEGFNTSLSIARQATDSGAFATRSYTANIAQGFQWGVSGSLNFNVDYSRYSSSGSGFSQRTEQLTTRLQADHREDNYVLQLIANKNVPVGAQAAQSFFGGVEKLPEITLSNYRFTGGFLSQVPATFFLSAGKYSEGAASTLGGAAKRATERAIFGFDLANSRFRLTSSTDLNVSTGFQQFLYGEGAAQYVVRNSTTLTQRWNRRSGLNLNYTYQRPEGGTPFRFDRQSQYHALNADIGFLDDRRLQLTARVGYDFARSGFGGLPAQPWQTLSANLLLRPVDWARVRNLVSFDPNTGKVLSVTSDLRFRGSSDFAFDLVTRYDPQRHRFGNFNGYFNLPIGNLWRIIGLFQYNGYLNRFESRNLQIVRDLHCLEASLTYIDNPFGFRSDRQIFFTLRIKAFPVFQRFGTGQFGQAIDTSVGEVF